MSRIVGNVDTPAKRRHAHERSCAEVLRLLAERREVDEQARDMMAFLVFQLRGIYATIDESAGAWDERDYWKKAEALREKYRWARTKADEMESALRSGAFERMPELLVSLIPYFSHITITTLTRDDDWWCGAWRALLKAPGGTSQTASR